MQRSSDIIGYGLRATDGAFGTIEDLLFDDQHWGLWWIVVNTGTWLPGRQVLLPPSALGAPDAATRAYPVDLSKEQIEKAPALETEKPVSRQLETDIYSHYGWEPYWFGGYGYPVAAAVPGAGPAAVSHPAVGAEAENLGDPIGRDQPAADVNKGDPNLRSASEVTGYYVEATDGNIGHVEDFLIDESEWAIRYLMIDTKNWWPGKMVLISPQWLRDIVWSSGKVFVDATRDKVKSAPEFDSGITVDAEYENRLYTHYGRQPY